MQVSRNYDDHEEQEGFRCLPDGNYMFEILEKEDTYSKDDDVMIKITLRCIEEGEYEGIYVWDNILLPEPDSRAHKIIGRSKRFLHAIGEPYQGNFDTDTDDWVGKTVEAKIILSEYTQGPKKGKPKNDVNGYLLSEPQQSEKKNNTDKIDPSRAKEEEEEDLPF